MDDVKVKASEYASMVGVSLNTVKNRIKAGVLKGGKEEDGIWYVYVPKDEYDHLLKSEERRDERQKELHANLEKLKAGLEGNLIATYIEIQMLKEAQKEELLHELSSLYTLLALREKELETLNGDIEKVEKELKEKEQTIKELQESLKRLEKEIKNLENKLRDREYELSQKDIQMQKLLLEKEKELLTKDMHIEKLKREIELREQRD